MAVIETPASPIITPPPPLTAGVLRGSTIISVFSLTLLLIALVFAYIIKNENLLVLLAGVIATNATSVVQFYVGSSSSSQAKDVTISNQLPVPMMVTQIRREPQ